MDIQALFDLVNESEMYRRVAEGQNMSLGQLIAALEAVADKGLPVVMDGRLVPKEVDSYRGHYSDLALSWYDGEEGETTVGQLLANLTYAVGAVFQGYKGGDFTMALLTPMWCANYGEMGKAIHRVEVSADRVNLITVPEEF